MRRHLWALIPVLLLAGSACSHRQKDEVSPVGAPVQVGVTNNYALPVEIYATASGANQRLGTVQPGMHGQFVIPPALIGGGSLELEARPGPSAPPFRSGPLLVAPGSFVNFVVASQLFNSTVTLQP